MQLFRKKEQKLKETESQFLNNVSQLLNSCNQGGENMEAAYEYIIDGVAYKDIILADGETVQMKPVGIVLAGGVVKLVDDL